MPSATAIGLVLALSSAAGAAEPPKPPFDLLASDADLARHLHNTEPTFSSGLGLCAGEKVQRSTEGAPQTFVYTAECAIKPLSDTPCPSYSVLVTGTIYGPAAATVQTVTLARLCPGQ